VSDCLLPHLYASLLYFTKTEARLPQTKYCAQRGIIFLNCAQYDTLVLQTSQNTLTATSTRKVKGDIMEHLQVMEDNTDVLPRQSFRVQKISETVNGTTVYNGLFRIASFDKNFLQTTKSLLK
jgi:hypothetical protein